MRSGRLLAGLGRAGTLGVVSAGLVGTSRDGHFVIVLRTGAGWARLGEMDVHDHGCGGGRVECEAGRTLLGHHNGCCARRGVRVGVDNPRSLGRKAWDGRLCGRV